jgi:hypothetical protein
MGAGYAITLRAGATSADVDGDSWVEFDVDLGRYTSIYADAVAADGATAHWRMADAADSASVAAQIGAIRGTYYNTPTLGAAGLVAGDPFATSASFAAASSEYASVPFNTIFDIGTGAGSYEMLLQLQATGVKQYLMERGTGAPALYIDTDGTVYFVKNNVANGAHSARKITDTTDMHHIVGTVDASQNWKVLIDGVDETVVDGTPTPAAGVTDALYIARQGSTTPANYLTAKVQEVAVYKGTAVPPGNAYGHYKKAKYGDDRILAQLFGGL